MARVDSPESPVDSNVPRCPICLEAFTDRSFTDPCFHSFCFTCILQWSEISNNCPMCKTLYTKLIHDVKADHSHEIHEVCPKSEDVPKVVSLSEARHFWFNSSVVPGQPAYRRRQEKNRVAAAQQRRRVVYSVGLWVKPLPPEGGKLRIRNISVQFFRQNPASTHRLVPWLKREFDVLVGKKHTEFLLQLVLSLVDRVELVNREFATHLTPFLHDRTDHFLHEFVSFAKSPYDMIAYDDKSSYDFTNHRGQPAAGTSGDGPGPSGSVSAAASRPVAPPAPEVGRMHPHTSIKQERRAEEVDSVWSCEEQPGTSGLSKCSWDLTPPAATDTTKGREPNSPINLISPDGREGCSEGDEWGVSRNKTPSKEASELDAIGSQPVGTFGRRTDADAEHVQDVDRKSSSVLCNGHTVGPSKGQADYQASKGQRLSSSHHRSSFKGQHRSSSHHRSSSKSQHHSSSHHHSSSKGQHHSSSHHHSSSKGQRHSSSHHLHSSKDKGHSSKRHHSSSKGQHQLSEHDCLSSKCQHRSSRECTPSKNYPSLSHDKTNLSSLHCRHDDHHSRHSKRKGKEKRQPTSSNSLNKRKISRWCDRSPSNEYDDYPLEEEYVPPKRHHNSSSRLNSSPSRHHSSPSRHHSSSSRLNSSPSRLISSSSRHHSSPTRHDRSSFRQYSSSPSEGNDSPSISEGGDRQRGSVEANSSQRVVYKEQEGKKEECLLEEELKTLSEQIQRDKRKLLKKLLQKEKAQYLKTSLSQEQHCFNQADS